MMIYDHRNSGDSGLKAWLLSLALRLSDYHLISPSPPLAQASTTLFTRSHCTAWLQYKHCTLEEHPFTYPSQA